ncbi:MAG TPA: YkvA family protein [Acidobacteriota bacterium]|nr:YkvA family protein [Acidobacteriota bacterium]HMZ81843.1 YkvA family protein [Acidobacteriota bacterium]HNC45435.1 YkvA family protein [Acidobacteriota bacterium]HNG92259.1 YkvA family protein [Acidobacteriota bacterium]HNH84326.1 YkvA family protein [Acidobacteriota bacterium]
MSDLKPPADQFSLETQSPSAPPERGYLKRQMRRALRFLPNLVKLAYRLIRDSRVSSRDKIILAGTILYVITPLDLIPDIIPFVGQIDDAYLIAVALLRLFRHTDPAVIREHWDGEGDIFRLLNWVSKISTFFLPKPVQRALIGKVQLPGGVVDFVEYTARRSDKVSDQAKG